MKTGMKSRFGWLLGIALCSVGLPVALMQFTSGTAAADDGIARMDDPILHAYQPPPPEDKDDADEPNDNVLNPPTGLRKLTPEEINRIRYLELRGIRLATNRPDRVTVKLSRETVEEFLIEMEGDPSFRGKKARRAFRKLTAPQKLHHIAYYKGAKYADKVEIKTDPEIFVEFRKKVMPLVTRTCAQQGCHASTSADDGVLFRLFKDPKRRPATTYANFLMLNETGAGRHLVIDRSQPENSLLLTYMLPAQDVRPELRHPSGITSKPVLKSRKTPAFRRLQKWIASLKHPQENYDVRLLPVPQGPATVEGDTGSPPSDTGEKPDKEPKKAPQPRPDPRT